MGIFALYTTDKELVSVSMIHKEYINFKYIHIFQYENAQRIPETWTDIFTGEATH